MTNLWYKSNLSITKTLKISQKQEKNKNLSYSFLYNGNIIMFSKPCNSQKVTALNHGHLMMLADILMLDKKILDKKGSLRLNKISIT